MWQRGGQKTTRETAILSSFSPFQAQGGSQRDPPSCPARQAEPAPLQVNWRQSPEPLLEPGVGAGGGG